MANTEQAYLVADLTTAERLAGVPSSVDQLVVHGQLNRTLGIRPGGGFSLLKAGMREYTFDPSGTLDIDLADCPATQEDEDHTGRKLIAHLLITGRNNVGNVTLTGAVANGYEYYNAGAPVVLPPGSAEILYSAAGLTAVASNKRLLRFTGSLNDTFQWLAVFGTPAA